MGPLQIETARDAHGQPGVWATLDPGAEPVFIARHQWIGVDLDGTLARDDAADHFQPPYPLGEPVPEMIARVKSLLAAGVTVKIFSARACEPESIPIIQAWTERHGLGRLGVRVPDLADGGRRERIIRRDPAAVSDLRARPGFHVHERDHPDAH